MWTRDLLKRNAKQVLRNNYWMALLVSFVAVLLCGEAKGPSFTFNFTTNSIQYNYGLPFPMAVLQLFSFIFIGIFLLAIAFTLFVSNPVRVGKCRYFMESRVGNAPFSTLFSAFKGPAYLNVVGVMFLKNLFIFLWTLLFIIPGIYKSYQYRMVDYLLAENPYMSYHRALELSRAMTDGEKFNIFVLDLSFIGWLLLGTLAFGIGVYFVNPYMEATYAELYAAMRAKAFATGLSTPDELSDFMRY